MESENTTLGNKQLAAERERRKPLVKALKRMPDLAYQVIIEHTGNVEDLPNELQCICDDALAKAKEGKENMSAEEVAAIRKRLEGIE